MFKNYITQSYLYQFSPEPELTAYLWNGETDYSEQGTLAEQIVLSDFVNRGYNVRLLRPELELDITTGAEDIASRNRAVVVTSAVTGTATVTISGSNELDGTYTSCGSVTVTATGTSTFLLSALYAFYKYSTSGVITVTSAGLIESNYDLFYAYKWLELIMKTARGQAGDIYDIKAQDFGQAYENLFASAKLWIDYDEDDSLATNENLQSGQVKLIR